MEVRTVERVQSPLACPQLVRVPKAQRPFPGPEEDPDLNDTDFEEDDLELDPTDEAWDPLDFDEDDEEPEPEYGDFWQEPDDFED